MYSRRIKDFWVDYRRNRIGLMGIAIIVVFAFLAAFAPWLTPYDPRDQNLAEQMAMPQWVTMLPQYNDLPSTITLSVNWNATPSKFVDVEFGDELMVNWTGGEMETDIYLGVNFSYSYGSPQTFNSKFRWSAGKVKEIGYSLELILARWGSEEHNYSMWDSYYGDSPLLGHEIPLSEKDKKSFVQIYSTLLVERFGFDPRGSVNVAEVVFSEKGEYGLLMHIRFRPKSENATCEIRLRNTEFEIPGLVHGILGVDKFGSDLFSQLIYGTRISLTIGVLTALITTTIGTVVGVVAGYSGGVVDEILMRIVDIMLSLPALPLILVLVFVFGTNVFYLILIIGALGWQGLARIVRSQTLSLREMAFIESVKVAGASGRYIIFRHIVPNVLPIAFSAMVLAVPNAIIAEAALSFLGWGDPRLTTWGRMLNQAFNWGAIERLAWWWVLPPALCTMILSAGFVFIGHAVDEVVNPRLRMRR